MGIGDSTGGGLAVDSGAGPMYNTSGQYIGGSPVMDFWCNSILGSWTDQCRILTPAQITVSQKAELEQTSTPPDVINQALEAGDDSVKADAAANPQEYKNQIAAAEHPTLSAMFGPGTVAALFPKDVTDPNNPKSTFPWLMIALGIGGVVALSAVVNSLVRR